MKFYTRLSWALIVATLAIVIFFISVKAAELTPPYVIATKDTGVGTPQRTAADPVTGYSYVLDQQGKVWVFDETDIVATLPVGTSPDIGIDPGHYAYISSGGGGAIRVLDGTQLVGVVSGITQPSGAVAVLTSTTPHYAYVVLRDNNAVAVLNGTQVVNTAVTVGITPTAIAANPTTGLVYVANSGDNTVSIIENNAVVATVGVGTTPNAVAVNPNNGYVYVANTGDNTVTVLSGTSIVSAAINVGVIPNDIAVNPTDDKVYIVNNGFNTNVGSISILSGTQWLKNINVGNDPRAVDVNPQTGYIYVAGGRGETGTVAVLSDTLIIETFLPVGHSPGDIAINPTTDLAYVPLYKSSSGSTGQVVIMGRTEAAIITIKPEDSETQFDTGNPDVTIEIPGDAVNGAITLRYTEWEPDTSPYLFAEPGFILKAYTINGVHLPSYQFKHPLNLQVVSPMSEDDLTLRTGRSGMGHDDWVVNGTKGIASQTLDPGGSLVTAAIETLPEYSHAGYALTTSNRYLYLPITMRAYP